MSLPTVQSQAHEHTIYSIHIYTHIDHFVGPQFNS